MPARFDKLLIANRGEIAVRIVRAAQELGLRTVAVYSDADAQGLAVQMADEAVRIGPAPAGKSYLNAEAIVQAALQSGAGAVHPGYGFLSENADFAQRVEAAGLVFVGPAPHSIRSMGDKAAARAAALRAGVATVAGSEGVVADAEHAVAVAAGIGYPIMLKASAGGGGRGIRVAHDASALRQQFATASAEAQAAFGNGAVYLERFVRHARHVEVQILGDGERVVHCFERECSLQRRRQKVWEEAPSVALDAPARAALCASALRLAQAVAYRGAATLEYLYDSDAQEFFFIEMNTRIQVEHPVTEMLTGVDLVKEMICIALGEPLRLRQEDIRPAGAAIEVRINAENAAKGFMPSPGVVSKLVVPGGPGVRFDSMLFPGCTVPAYYDSLLGKLIVHDRDRPSALARMRRALNELRIDGVQTTIALHQALCEDAQVAAADFHTGFLESWLETHPLATSTARLEKAA
ncbi:acetyl-CoA carboxylase biotin carboxylase subunit [Verminephrobacter aporrectodeae subsp. tuberculatae]|uniref:acetyl-CoA carboxylase biotin carboxylase subunit n=1 Tax=Verminephrobacter aporrectodeae TaxID=1110389 RepID=UPI0005937F84|nr:acetyl-CoA carboxylase biotin carboxylase subunit [Verminephrobacter aporrectodeae]MCW8163347.1 acetyl-CoA carboxylase biotin carboxylase subunit [Verminephrobacter aporrectodeae subsp. tuberculatae]MCW8167576.1 acetyl-CoA carboxylase biotin carboxylase subunit [Verminephrobacter aporrectodeae subsp. tuberculatae]